MGKGDKKIQNTVGTKSPGNKAKAKHMKQLLAHFSEDGRRHCLIDHLTETAKRASTFASVFDSAAWAQAAGTLHDLGKAHPAFQDYLLRGLGGLDASEYDDLNTGKRPNHSGVGGILAYEKWHSIVGKTLAYIIMGHHAGLPDWFGGRDSLTYRLEDERSVADAVRDYAKPFLEAIPESLQFPTFAMHCNKGDAIAYHLWVRMVYSCLVDADFLDTENFMDTERHTERPRFSSLSELKATFDRKIQVMVSNAPVTQVNRIRSGILVACRTAASQSPGLFSLTVPTGGGKTLSGTAFALDHAVKKEENRKEKSRIIYVIPYTSIIEQTADELRKYLGTENVVEHHSNIAPEKEAESTGLTLAAENWDAPVIVTTSVQFFESLYSAKPGRCRKLHNIVNSVVILDEVQLLPPELLHPCVEVLNRLVSDYRVTVVLCTATPPALPKLDHTPRPIVSDPDLLYKRLKRTNIVFPADLNSPLDWPTLAAQLVQHDQVLCVVNTRPDCHALWEEMPKGTIHLSALMCGAHRSKVIAEVKGRLRQGEVCRVISTQLVEAGVDMSFPVVYRALAGLDSINQAAGRCNREGERLERGEVKVFVAPKPAPPGLLRKGEDTTRELVSLPGFVPDTPDAFHRYSEKYYSSINDTGENWWRENLVKNVNPEGNVQFRTAGKEFRLIKDPSVPIIVRCDGNDKTIERLRFGGPSREVMRALQRYSVNVKPRVAGRLLAKGRIEEICEGILVQADSKLYDPVTGLDIYRETYEPEDLYI